MKNEIAYRARIMADRRAETPEILRRTLELLQLIQVADHDDLLSAETRDWLCARIMHEGYKNLEAWDDDPDLEGQP